MAGNKRVKLIMDIASSSDSGESKNRGNSSQKGRSILKSGTSAKKRANLRKSYQASLSQKKHTIEDLVDSDSSGLYEELQETLHSQLKQIQSIKSSVARIEKSISQIREDQVKQRHNSQLKVSIQKSPRRKDQSEQRVTHQINPRKSS